MRHLSYFCRSLAADILQAFLQAFHKHFTSIFTPLLSENKKTAITFLKLSAQPYGQPNAKYVHFCTCTRYLMCT